MEGGAVSGSRGRGGEEEGEEEFDEEGTELRGAAKHLGGRQVCWVVAIGEELANPPLSHGASFSLGSLAPSLDSPKSYQVLQYAAKA